MCKGAAFVSFRRKTLTRKNVLLKSIEDTSSKNQDFERLFFFVPVQVKENISV